MLVDVPEDERQIIILALAHLAVERPGWSHALTCVASRLDGVVMFAEFHAYRTQGPPTAHVPDPPGPCVRARAQD